MVYGANCFAVGKILVNWVLSHTAEGLLFFQNSIGWPPHNPSAPTIIGEDTLIVFKSWVEFSRCDSFFYHKSESCDVIVISGSATCSLPPFLAVVYYIFFIKVSIQNGPCQRCQHGECHSKRSRRSKGTFIPDSINSLNKQFFSLSRPSGCLGQSYLVYESLSIRNYLRVLARARWWYVNSYQALHTHVVSADTFLTTVCLSLSRSLLPFVRSPWHWVISCALLLSLCTLLFLLLSDLEWKVLYVGSAQDASRDQILDEILVGPVPVGVNKFVLQADAPDPSKLPPEDLLGVTVVLVTCSYKEREFVRVGYYVNNEYHDPNAPPPSAQQEGEEPPALPSPIPLEHIQRQILADKPRVTKFPISWGDEPLQQQQQTQLPP